jgi:hypothetical protein
MAKPKKKGGPIQKLSPEASKRKKRRDEEIAKSPRRMKMKAENRKKRIEAKKNGEDIRGKDYDHKDRKFKSVKRNRGNDGKGTKKERK